MDFLSFQRCKVDLLTSRYLHISFSVRKSLGCIFSNNVSSNVSPLSLISSFSLSSTKEEMASFVQEVDKAYVALGDSFDGGLEGVVDSLGKIKGLFEETKGQS